MVGCCVVGVEVIRMGMVRGEADLFIYLFI